MAIEKRSLFFIICVLKFILLCNCKTSAYSVTTGNNTSTPSIDGSLSTEETANKKKPKFSVLFHSIPNYDDYYYSNGNIKNFFTCQLPLIVKYFGLEASFVFIFMDNSFISMHHMCSLKQLQGNPILQANYLEAIAKSYYQTYKDEDSKENMIKQSIHEKCLKTEIVGNLLEARQKFRNHTVPCDTIIIVDKHGRIIPHKNKSATFTQFHHYVCEHNQTYTKQLELGCSIDPDDDEIECDSKYLYN